MHPVIGEEMARKILRRLKFDNQTIKQVTTLVRWHDHEFASIEEVNRKQSDDGGQPVLRVIYRLMEGQKADISAQSEYQRDRKNEHYKKQRVFEEIVEKKLLYQRIKDQWKRLDGYFTEKKSVKSYFVR